LASRIRRMSGELRLRRRMWRRRSGHRIGNFAPERPLIPTVAKRPLRLAPTCSVRTYSVTLVGSAERRSTT
jgi:hypothetical protein